MDIIETDVAVLGAGLAGIIAALRARDEGCRVVIVGEWRVPCASERSAGNFRTPVSGYAAEEHFVDTVIGGEYLAQRSLAKAIAQGAEDARSYLTGHGIEVEQGPRGFRVPAAQNGSSPAGCPGDALVRKLLAALEPAGVKLVKAFGWEVLLDGGAACGLLAYDSGKAQWLVVKAGAVVLATGGAAGAYLRTDNSVDATGDGMAMAFRAGAALADMEFVQFWPLTGLSDDVCEILPFGSYAGKRLLAGGRDITDKVGLEELAAGRGDAARTARLIYQEMVASAAGDGQEQTLSLVPPGGKPPVAVTPAAHHTMGGVVGGDHGQTRVDRLLVAGETAAGVHGANRISGNGLTEAVVMGQRAGSLAALMAKGLGAQDKAAPVDRLARDSVRHVSALLEGSAAATLHPAETTRQLKQAMWLQAGPVRSRESLDATQSTINKIKRSTPLAVDLSNGEEVRAGLKALNLLLVAEAITRSARYRRESRGVHFRTDYPEKDDAEWLKHIRVQLLNGEMSLDISQGLELMEP